MTCKIVMWLKQFLPPYLAIDHTTKISTLFTSSTILCLSSFVPATWFHIASACFFQQPFRFGWNLVKTVSANHHVLQFLTWNLSTQSTRGVLAHISNHLLKGEGSLEKHLRMIFFQKKKKNLFNTLTLIIRCSNLRCKITYFFGWISCFHVKYFIKIFPNDVIAVCNSFLLTKHDFINFRIFRIYVFLWTDFTRWIRFWGIKWFLTFVIYLQSGFVSIPLYKWSEFFL